MDLTEPSKALKAGQQRSRFLFAQLFRRLLETT